MINIIVKNSEEYTLSVSKNKCESPEELYKIVITEQFRGGGEKDSLSVREHIFYMTEQEIDYFTRALIV